MEDKVRRYFNQIIEDAKAVLEDLEIEQDYSVKRALLKISGNFRNFRVRITEVVDEDKRKYAYYLITNGQVIIGFDNAPESLSLSFLSSLGHFSSPPFTPSKTHLSIHLSSSCRTFLPFLCIHHLNILTALPS